MNPQAAAELLKVARRALEAAVRGQPPPAPAPAADPELQARCGCFVTYKSRGRLRGCIGCFSSGRPLAETVAEYARASALEDWRFAADPITLGELPDVRIEISVLSPLRRVADPREVQPGVHGIHVESGGRSGCFLPQVAVEHRMTREQFLSECCAHKAGLPADAWRNPGTSISVFTAEIISEPQAAGS